jgi:hypothetical protein
LNGVNKTGGFGVGYGLDKYFSGKCLNRTVKCAIFFPLEKEKS